MRLINFKYIFPFLLTISFFITKPVYAAAVFWDGGGGDSLWTNPLNWSDDNIPGLDDDVTIDLDTRVILSDGDAVAKSVIIGIDDTLKIYPAIKVLNCSDKI